MKEQRGHECSWLECDATGHGPSIVNRLAVLSPGPPQEWKLRLVGRKRGGQEERRLRERAGEGAGPHTHTRAHAHTQEELPGVGGGVGSVAYARGGFSPTSHTL